MVPKYWDLRKLYAYERETDYLSLLATHLFMLLMPTPARPYSEYSPEALACLAVYEREESRREMNRALRAHEHFFRQSKIDAANLAAAVAADKKSPWERRLIGRLYEEPPAVIECCCHNIPYPCICGSTTRRS